MSATANTSAAGRFGASRPPVFGGRSTFPAASTPSDSPFASGVPIVWRGNVAATPFSSDGNPFAQPSARVNAAGVSGGAFGTAGSSTGSFGTNSFRVRQPLPPTASPFGRPNPNFGSIGGFGQIANASAHAAGCGVSAPSGATAPAPTTTGWFPLGDVSSTPKSAQASPFGAPVANRSRPAAPANPFLGSTGSRNVARPSNPFATFRTDNRNIASAPTNPFAVGNGTGVVTGVVQKIAFSTHRSGRTPSRTNQSTAEVGGVDPFGLHSDIAVVTPRPFAPAWQFSAGPTSTLIPNAGVHRSSSPGFRFTVTPSWSLNAEKPAEPQQPKGFSSCLAFPKPAAGSWPGAKQGVAQIPSSFAFKCGSDWNTTPTANAGSAPPTGFDAKLSPEATQSTEQEPKRLVAFPDVNPYGAGTFGSGSLDVAVQAALSFEHAASERSSNFFLSPKPKPKASASHANLGLPTRPINCYQLKTSRRLIGERNLLRVASIRRAVGVRSARNGVSNGGEQRAPAAQGEFTFKSSLFRELDSKKEPVTESVGETKGDPGGRECPSRVDT